MSEMRGGRQGALLMSRARGKPGWAGPAAAGLRLPASLPRQQGGVGGLGHGGVATGQKAPKRRTIRPEHPGTCPPPLPDYADYSGRSSLPLSHRQSPSAQVPRSAHLHPSSWSQALFATLFSRGRTASSSTLSPGPQGVASVSITKPCDKKCSPLIKIM